MNRNNERVGENTDEFIKYLERLDIPSSQKVKILTSYATGAKNTLFLLPIQIEAWFWIPIGLFGFTGGPMLVSEDSFSPSEKMLLVSGLATSYRGLVAYILGDKYDIEDPSLFACIEIIPYIGRFAPILWAEEHEDFFIYYTLWRQGKNSDNTSKIHTLKSIFSSLRKIHRILLESKDRIKDIF